MRDADEDRIERTTPASRSRRDCALPRILPEITKIRRHGIDDAWNRVVEKRARYRYVIDVGAR